MHVVPRKKRDKLDGRSGAAPARGSAAARDVAGVTAPPGSAKHEFGLLKPPLSAVPEGKLEQLFFVRNGKNGQPDAKAIKAASAGIGLGLTTLPPRKMLFKTAPYLYRADMPLRQKVTVSGTVVSEDGKKRTVFSGGGTGTVSRSLSSPGGGGALPAAASAPLGTPAKIRSASFPPALSSMPDMIFTARTNQNFVMRSALGGSIAGPSADPAGAPPSGSVITQAAPLQNKRAIAFEERGRPTLWPLEFFVPELDFRRGPGDRAVLQHMHNELMTYGWGDPLARVKPKVIRQEAKYLRGKPPDRSLGIEVPTKKQIKARSLSPWNRPLSPFERNLPQHQGYGLEKYELSETARAASAGELKSFELSSKAWLEERAKAIQKKMAPDVRWADKRADKNLSEWFSTTFAHHLHISYKLITHQIHAYNVYKVYSEPLCKEYVSALHNCSVRAR